MWIKILKSELFRLFVAGIIISILSLLLVNTRKEAKRLGENQDALLSEIVTYKTADSLNASKVKRLVLEKSEFKKYESELLDKIESMGLKLKRLESVSHTGIETNTSINVEIKDSLIYLPGKIDTIRCINFIDPFTSINGCAYEDTFIGVIKNRVEIIQTIDRVPKKFWFIKYGTKGIEQTIVTTNPNSEISYSKYIEIK